MDRRTSATLQEVFMRVHCLPAPPAVGMARPLRILLLNERCHANPMAGGAETHLFEIFSRLVTQGVSVELLCSGFAGAAAYDEHRGLRIARLGTRLSFYLHVRREVLRRVRASGVDLIIEAHNKVPFLTPLYVRGVPVLVIHHHLHGLTAFRQVSPLIAASSVLLERLIPPVYRQVPFLTISKSSKDDLVRRGVPEDHIDVVPCGIDHDLHRAAPTSGRSSLVLALGRLEPYKRLDLLLHAWPSVLAHVPAARLQLIGRGGDEARLHRLAARLHLQDTVTFTGFVSNAEKLAALQRAALLVQCSSKEGWGLTVSEAYACGTPVVASDVPGLSDSVQDGVTGVLVRKVSPEALGGAVTKLLLDEEARRRMATRALAWSVHFDWNESAAAVLRAARAAVERETRVRPSASLSHEHLPAMPAGAGVPS